MSDVPSALSRFPIRYLAIHGANVKPSDEPLYIERGREFSLCLHPGSFEFSVSIPIVTQTPPIAGMTMAVRQAQVPPGSYWVVEMEFLGIDPSSIRSLAALRVAEAISTIDLRYEGIVLQRVFEGVINTPGGSLIMLPEGPLTLMAAPPREAKEVVAELIADFTALAALPPDRRERFRLASRWFRRGREAVNLVDKLLFLWTVLEVFPAEGTTNVVGKTSAFLHAAIYPQLSLEAVRSKLMLGRIYHTRGEIVHNGKAFVGTDEEERFEDCLKRLHATCVVSLRLLAGGQPGHELDEYVI